MTDVALRDVHSGRVWRANACRLVQEGPDLAVVWAPAGSPRVLPVDGEGDEIRLPWPEWELEERRTTTEALVLIRPGVRHSLGLHWDSDRRFQNWYVNFERPLGRTRLGWDYVDEKLDLIVLPDGSLRWKDEDELAEAARRGILDEAAVRAEAARVLADPPWPTGWEEWRPDAGWPVPGLPEGWDAV